MNINKKLLIILGFNVFLMVFELIGGILSGSLALVSDSVHMFADSFALFLTYTALVFSKTPANDTKTYGYHRLEILASFANGILLVLVTGFIGYNAIARFFQPFHIETGLLLIVASAGFIGNLAGLMILKDEHQHSLNIKGAFYHMLGDTLSSVGVVAGAVIIRFTGFAILDSIVSLGISLLILKNALSLIIDSGHILLEGVPESISIREIKSSIESIKGVREFHDIHIWSITSGKYALSGHILIDDILVSDSQKIVCEIKALLLGKFAIDHSAIEIECESCPTSNKCHL